MVTPVKITINVMGQVIGGKQQLKTMLLARAPVPDDCVSVQFYDREDGSLDAFRRAAIASFRENYGLEKPAHA